MKNKAMRGVRAGIAACALLLSATLLAAAGVYLYQIRVWKDGQGLFQDLPFFAYEGLWATALLSAGTALAAEVSAVHTWTVKPVRFPVRLLLCRLFTLCLGASTRTSASEVLRTRRRETAPAVAVALFLPPQHLDRGPQIGYDR